jgi:hypothetical protein
MNARRKKEALFHLRFVKSTGTLPAKVPLGYKAYRKYHRAVEAKKEELRLIAQAARANHDRVSRVLIRKQQEEQKRLSEMYWRAVGAGSNRFESTSTDSYGKCINVAKLWQSGS